MTKTIDGPIRTVRGTVTVPGDKSISHRALMLGAVAWGETRISGLLESADVLGTVEILSRLGVDIRKADEGVWVVSGVGVGGFRTPDQALDCGNSGTTLRLMAGLLAGNKGRFLLTGDDSLKRRPMLRIVEPLRSMGADIGGRERGKYPPLVINGARIRPANYDMPVASAQVKSCLLLAGLHVDGRSQVREPAPTRDHTERMLEYFGVLCGREDGWVWVRGPARPGGRMVNVPGDLSSAAFFFALAAVAPGSHVQVVNVGLNPTRSRFLEVLERMGANVHVIAVDRKGPEPMGDIEAGYGDLRGVRIGPDEVPLLIDEIPILAVLGAFAEGETRFEGAGELRVKESDRIAALVRNLKAMGAEIEEWDDGFAVHGPAELKGAQIDPGGDHRIAMAMAVAALGAQGRTRILEPQCADVSFPGFFETLERICET